MKKVARRLANKKRSGFTLVELIVVIAILAILAVGAVVAFGNVRETAEKNTALANASIIARALNTYNALANQNNIKSDWTDYDNLLLITSGANPDLVELNLSVSLSSDEMANITKYVDFSGGGSAPFEVALKSGA